MSLDEYKIVCFPKHSSDKLSHGNSLIILPLHFMFGSELTDYMTLKYSVRIKKTKNDD